MGLHRPALHLVAVLTAAAFAAFSSATARGGGPVDDDRHGLPAGARFRLGTLDLRHTEPTHARLRFSPDDKYLFSCDGRGVIRWDLQGGMKTRVYEQGWLYALSPDGKTLGLIGEIHELHLIDVATGKERLKIDAKDWIRCAAFSPDSELVYIGTDDKPIRAWQVSDGKQVRKFKKAAGSVGRLWPSADGKTCICLASVLPSTLQVFETESGKVLYSLRNVLAAAAAADGKTVVASREGDIIVWDATTGKTQTKFTANKDPIPHLALSPDGNTLALAGYDEIFRVYDLSNVNQPRMLQELRGPAYALTFSSDSKTLAAAGWGGVIRLWQIKDGKELHDGGHRDAVVSLAFSPDSKSLISRGLDHTVRVWDLTAAKETRRFAVDDGVGGHAGREPLTVFFALEGNSLLRSAPGGLGLLDLKTGKERIVENAPMGSPLAMSADGKIAVIYRLQGSLKDKSAALTWALWDRARGEKIGEFVHAFNDAPPGADAGASPAAVAISPDGRFLAASWYYLGHGMMYTKRVGQGVSLWEIASGKERHIGTSAAAHVTFIDGGKTLVCADGKGAQRFVVDEPEKSVMEFWDVATGKRRRVVETDAAWGGVLAFSPDGSLFASASGMEDTLVYVWRTVTGTQLRRFTGHRREVESLAFSPDGRLLASGSRDTTILVWEVQGWK
jgi:WD40 repeat protein